MLLQHFAGDEWEVVELALLMVLFILVFLNLVLELLLVVEEEEFVLENLAAAHLHVLLLRIAVSDLGQVLPVLLNLRLALLTLLLQVLAHLAEMILQQVLIVEHASDGYTLAEANHVGRAVLRRGNSVPSAKELLL